MREPKKKTDGLKEVFGTINSMAAATGVLVVFYYCFFELHFFPSGLTLGEGLLFVFVALGFGLLYVFFLGIGFACVYALAQPFHPKLKNQSGVFDRWMLFSGGVILLIFIGISSLAIGDWKTFFAIILEGWILLIASALWDENPPGISRSARAKRPMSRIIITSIGLVFPLFFGAKYVELVAHKSISGLGLTKKNVSLILSKENYSAVQAAAREFKIPVFGCHLGEDKIDGIVHGADALWHGMGSKSLFQFGSRISSSAADADKERLFRIELESAGVKLLDSTDTNGKQKPSGIKTCLDIGTDTLFDNYSSTLNSEGRRQIDRFVSYMSETLNTHGLHATAATITGFSDITPVAVKGDSNIDLSNRRARAVEEAMTVLLAKIPKEKKITRGRGSADAITKCEPNLPTAEKTECRAPDRKVRIELLLEQN